MSDDFRILEVEYGNGSIRYQVQFYKEATVDRLYDREWFNLGQPRRTLKRAQRAVRNEQRHKAVRADVVGIDSEDTE